MVAISVSCLILILVRLVDFVYANAGFVMVNQAMAGGDSDVDWSRVVWWLERVDLNMTGRGAGFALAVLEREDAALAAWQQAGEGAQDFLVRGISARKLGDWETAVTWFNRAARINPDLADTWYELGLTYEGLEDSQKAIAAYEQGLTKTEFSQTGVSDFYLQLGLVNMQSVERVDWETAVYYYDQALLQNNFGNGLDEVRAHYLKAEAFSRSGQTTQAIAEYEWVITQQPEHYWAHARLGFLLWNAQKDATAAETLFLQALALNSQQKAAYRGLGIVYQETGRHREAIEMYQKLLSLDPTDTNAQTALATLEQ